jgi:hypothetical protein
MAIRLRPDGTWEFDTAADALAFERQRKAKGGSQGTLTATEPTKPAKPSRDYRAERERAGRGGEDRAVPALKLMVDAGSKGVSTDTLSSELGLVSARGFSGVLQGIKRNVNGKCNGMPFDQLVWSKGKPGRKVWFADGRKLREHGVIQ